MSSKLPSEDPFQIDESKLEQSNSMALFSLILGCFAFCLSFLTGLPAIILGILALNKASKSDGRMGGQGLAIAGIITGGIGCLVGPILVAILLPAISAARDAARRAESQSNLRQITLGAMMFETQQGSFPAVADNSAGPPVSWRTEVLPYLEQSSLAEQYDRSLAWDEGSNRQVSETVIPVYKNPSFTVSPMNYTSYLALVGSDTAFPPDGRLSMRHLRDGQAQTILFVEADEDRAVPWAKPEDIQYDPADPKAGLGAMCRGNIIVSFADGSVREVSADVDPEIFGAAVTPSGGDNASGL